MLKTIGRHPYLFGVFLLYMGVYWIVFAVVFVALGAVELISYPFTARRQD